MLAIAALAVAAADRPAPSVVRPEPIARAARHPGPLLVREESIGELARTYGTPVWVASVSAADGSFAPMRVVLIEGGSPLAAQLAEGRAALVRPVPLASGRRGYAAILGLTPDATRVAIVLPSPDARYEVVITVEAPFLREGATVAPELGRYRTRLAGAPLDSVQEMALSVYQQLFPPERKRRRVEPKP